MSTYVDIHDPISVIRAAAAEREDDMLHDVADLFESILDRFEVLEARLAVAESMARRANMFTTCLG